MVLLAGMTLLATAKALPARAEGSKAMNVVLLDDSIFDNQAYVGSGPDVITQLRGDLPAGWAATLAARDGSTTADIAGQLKAKIKAAFVKSYGAMLDGVLARKLPTAVCTIYEARYADPTTRQIAAVGLSVFNDVILRQAFARGVPVIDLRLIVDDDGDYANDMEPSVAGGAKIAKIIATLVTTHDFKRRRSEVYV